MPIGREVPSADADSGHLTIRSRHSRAGLSCLVPSALILILIDCRANFSKSAKAGPETEGLAPKNWIPDDAQRAIPEVTIPASLRR